jgi:gluconate kinase
VLERRLTHRPGHYMPASLLPSQLATLEQLASDEPGAVIVDEGTPQDVLAALVAQVEQRTGRPVAAAQGAGS